MIATHVVGMFQEALPFVPDVECPIQRTVTGRKRRNVKNSGRLWNGCGSGLRNVRINGSRLKAVTLATIGPLTIIPLKVALGPLIPPRKMTDNSSQPAGPVPDVDPKREP